MLSSVRSFVPPVAVCLLIPATRTQARVVDLRPTTSTSVHRIEHRLAVFGKHVYYAGSGTTGVELYRTHVAQNSVQLVRDIHPGTGSSFPFGFTVVGTWMFFFAADGTRGFELWHTDGTTTRLVKDIYPGIASSLVPNHLVREPMGELRGLCLFAAEGPTGGYALWRSDGTAAGTVLVKSLGSWSGRTPFFDYTQVAGFGFFLAPDERTEKIHLWQTDGTSLGTEELASFALTDGSFLEPRHELTRVGAEIYVTGGESVTRIVPGTGQTQVTRLITGSGFLHSGFAAVPDPSVANRYLLLFSGGSYFWRSDGTAPGTRSFYPRSGLGVLNSPVQTIHGSNQVVMFYGFDLQHGEELWRTDGTGSGTALVKDIRPGPKDSVGTKGYGRDRRIVSDGTRFFFAANDGVNGLELWESDGNAQNTRMLVDVRAGAGDSFPRSTVALPSGGVAFIADDTTGTGLWIYRIGVKPRRAATNFVTFTGQTEDPHVLGITRHNGLVYFSADDGKSGSELWTSNGTAAGSMLVGDLHAGTGSGLRHHDLAYGPSYGELAGITVGPHLYFTGYRADRALALFRTDGSRNGTVPLFDLDLIGGGGWNLRGAAVGDHLYTHGYTKKDGEGLYVLRPGARSLTRVAGGVLPGSYHRLGDKLVFTDGSPPAFRGVWVSDGTKAYALMKFSRFLFGPFFLRTIGRHAFFSITRSGGELWRTDATVAGTTRLRLAAVRAMTVLRDELFTLEDGAGGVRLMRGDGTSSGTRTVAMGLPFTSQQLVTVGFRVFFVAFIGDDSELWTSDGSAAGTKMLKHFPAVGKVVPLLSEFLPVGSRRLFFRVGAAHDVGSELWQSDGTTTGTRLVADIHRGPGSSEVRGLTLAAGQLFFRADDGRTGSENGDLWSLHPGGVAYDGGPGCAADGFVPRLTGTDPVMGQTMDIEIAASPQKSGVFLLGLPLPRPLAFFRGCQIYPEPTTAFSTPITTNGTGRWSMTKVAVPNQASVKGLRLVSQAAVASGPTMPFGSDFSNPLVLVVGR